MKLKDVSLTLWDGARVPPSISLCYSYSKKWPNGSILFITTLSVDHVHAVNTIIKSRTRQGLWK